MAIEILTGVPGAGKSYYAVHKISKLLESDKSFLILHNIEGLNPLDNRCISENWTTESFNADLMADHLRGLRTEYNLSSDDPIYFFIDEAQRFFPPELRNSDVLYFFDYHRHYGINITLITQHEKKLTYKITTLAEVEIRAISTRINPFGSFIYKLSSGGEQYGRERLRKDQNIFKLYKSFQAGTGKSKKSNFRYIALGLAVAGPLMWFLFFRVFAASFGLVEGSDSFKDLPQRTESVADRPASGRPTFRDSFRPPEPLVSQSVNDTQETSYLGPEILEYSLTRDALRYEQNELSVWIPVSQFLEDYPPHLYGYGYFHCSNKRFVLLSASNHEHLFPVENKVYIRPFIQSEPPLIQTAERPEYPLEYLNKTEKPDQSGYTRSDYERVYLRQRGFKYYDPPAVPAQPAEHMQAGEQPGAALGHPQF